MKQNTPWEYDIWKSAEDLATDCASFIEDLQYSSRQHVAQVNPSGRFQDLVLRQLQHLSQLVQISVDDRDDNFLVQVNDFCEYIESIGLNSEELSNKLESVETSFDVTESEVLFQSEKIIVPKHDVLVLSVKLLLAEITRQPDTLFNVSPRQFEELVAEIFSQNGFSVELMQQTRDGGKDIIAVSNNMGIPTQYIIECKRYSHNKKVSLDIVQRLYGVKFALKASVGLVVTTSTFTSDALEFANQHPWELSLKDYGSLMGWISTISNNSSNTDRMLRYAPKPDRLSTR